VSTAVEPLSADELVIRPISPDDKDGLRESFDRLSEQSRYRRFLSPHDRLSAAELRYLTEVDHHDHEALVAVDPRARAGAGIARYIRSKEDPSSAELAVVVVDDWQGKGVGTRLASALAERAREEGVSVFTALVLAENDAMLRLAKDVGDVRVLSRDRGTVELAIELPEKGPGRLIRLLRAVASGQLRPTPRRGLPPRQRPFPRRHQSTRRSAPTR
jgi:GNAT superfamily N-acetyltransferase